MSVVCCSWMDSRDILTLRSWSTASKWSWIWYVGSESGMLSDPAPPRTPSALLYLVVLVCAGESEGLGAPTGANLRQTGSEHGRRDCEVKNPFQMWKILWISGLRVRWFPVGSRLSFLSSGTSPSISIKSAARCGGSDSRSWWMPWPGRRMNSGGCPIINNKTLYFICILFIFCAFQYQPGFNLINVSRLSCFTTRRFQVRSPGWFGLGPSCLDLAGSACVLLPQSINSAFNPVKHTFTHTHWGAVVSTLGRSGGLS